VTKFKLTNRVATPHTTVLEKVTVAQLVKKWNIFHGNGRSITVFTTAQCDPCPEQD